MVWRQTPEGWVYDYMPGMHSQGAPPQSDFTAKRMSELATLGDEEGLISDELQRAIALRDPQQQQHYGWLGGLIGSMGDILRSGAGAYREGLAREDLAKNRAAQTPLRATGTQGLLDAIRGQIRQQPTEADPLYYLRR